MKNPINILPYDGEAYLIPHLFQPGESETFYNNLKNEVEWKQEPIKMFGKLIMQPRLTAYYGDTDKSYTYSGITMNALTWTADLRKIKRRVEEASGACFSNALLNYYREGNDSMGWHRDNEKELGMNPVIASVSFGVSRKFQLREYSTKTNTININLEAGSLLFMKGSTQHHWEHCLPKAVKVSSGRINITFRTIKI